MSLLLRGEGSQPREDRPKGGRAQRRNNKTQTLAGKRKRDKAAARVWQGSQDIILTQKQQQKRQQQLAAACPPDSLTLQLPEPSPLAPWNANDTSKKKTTTYTQLIPSTLPMLAALQVSSIPYSCPYSSPYIFTGVFLPPLILTHSSPHASSPRTRSTSALLAWGSC